MNTSTDNTRRFLSCANATYRPTRNWFIATVLFNGIGDAIFVYRYHNVVDPVAFDTTNLYIGPDDALTAIPLRSISYIRLTYSRLNNFSRGFHRSYWIGYDLGAITEEVKVAIYRRSNEDFTEFKELVKQANPMVEIKNWAINM